MALALAGCGSKGRGLRVRSASAGPATIKTGPGVTGQDDHARRPHRPLRRVRPAGRAAHQGQPAVLEGAERQGRRLRPQGRADRQGPRLRPAEGRRAVPRHWARQIAGLQQLLGSPITAALLPTLKSDSMLSLLSAWPSSLLGNDFIIEIGAPYDIEMINGLDYLKDKGKIKSGDKIGHVYFEGEYGENGLKGSKYYASKNGMTVVEQKIQPTDEDMTGQVAALQAGRRQGDRGHDGSQAAGLGGRHRRGAGPQRADRRQQPDVRPGRHGVPGRQGAAGQHVHRRARSRPGPRRARGREGGRRLHQRVRQEGRQGSRCSSATSRRRSCTRSSTRRARTRTCRAQGLVKAAHELSGVDTGGLVGGPLDYTKVGEPSTRAVYIARPAEVIGGLKPLPQTFESDTAKSYDVGAST